MGRRVAQLRDERGWGVEDLAAAAGLAADEVEATEAAAIDVPLPSLWRLADALGVPLPDLLAGL